MDQQTNTATNALANGDNAAEFAKWLQAVTQFRSLLFGQSDNEALFQIPEGGTVEQLQSLVGLWTALNLQPTSGNSLCYGALDLKASDPLPQGATPWGETTCFSEQAIMDMVRGTLFRLHQSLQEKLAAALAARPALYPTLLSTRGLKWRLQTPWYPPAGPVLLNRDDLPPGHILLDKLDVDCCWHNPRPCYVLQARGCILHTAFDGTIEGGPLPILRTADVVQLTQMASQPDRDAAEQRKQLALREQRELTAFLQDQKNQEKNRIAALEKEFAALKAQREQVPAK